jgi:glycosyltransferase involved in cell wall biosynthesis
VACSNTTAMPEVANASALLFDPHSRQDMARAMIDVLADPGLRVRLERLGLQRAACFSWQRAAQQTMNVYYDVAGAGRVREKAVSARAS